MGESHILTPPSCAAPPAFTLISLPSPLCARACVCACVCVCVCAVRLCAVSQARSIRRRRSMVKRTTGKRWSRRWPPPRITSRRPTAEPSPFRYSRSRPTPECRRRPAALESASASANSSSNSRSSRCRTFLARVCAYARALCVCVVRVCRGQKLIVTPGIRVAAAAVHDSAVLCLLFRVRHQQRHLAHHRL
jgi:hypothetical protein